MRSTFVKPRCTALSSSFDTHVRSIFVRFRYAALSSSFDAQHFRQASMRSTFVKFRCTDATHNALQHYHSCVYHSCVRSAHATSALQVQHARRAMMVISCALLFASPTMASPPPPPPTTTKKRHICVWISSPENVCPVQFILGEGGGDSKEITRFRFFANIGNYGRPLSRFSVDQLNLAESISIKRSDSDRLGDWVSYGSTLRDWKCDDIFFLEFLSAFVLKSPFFVLLHSSLANPSFISLTSASRPVRT